MGSFVPWSFPESRMRTIQLLKPWQFMQFPQVNDTVDDYPEENMEDETRTQQVADSRMTGGLGFGAPPAQIGAADMANMMTTETPPASSLSSDSLAFTLVYCSVFTITILYIAFKLSKKWRKQRNRGLHGGDEMTGTAESPVRRCNHAVCQQAHEANRILPYSGLGAMWIPEMRSLDGARGFGMAVHHSAHCNNSCESCIKLSQPPPSYSKLFLDENPPTYNDAVIMESAVDNVMDSSAVQVSRTSAVPEEAAPSYTAHNVDSIAVQDIEGQQPVQSNSVHNDSDQSRYVSSTSLDTPPIIALSSTANHTV